MLGILDQMESILLLWDLCFKGDPLNAQEVQDFLDELLTQRIEHTRWFDYAVLKLRASEWASGAMTWNNLAYDLRQIIKTDALYKNRINQS